MRHAVAVFLLMFLGSSVLAEEPTEGSLVAAWEAVQRADPKTAVFERVGEGRYRFETTRFPFKGELSVLTVNLEDVELPGDGGTVMGAIEVELVGAPADLAAKHAVSYGSWHAGNVLYFDRAAGRWITGKEWQRTLQKRYSPWSGWPSLGNVLFVGLLVLMIAVLLRTSRRAGTQMKAAMSAQERALADQQQSLAMMRRSLELADESVRLLREILAELKARRPE